MSTKPPKPPKPEDLPAAIDPAALAQVTGGTSDSTGLVTALNGLLNDVKSIQTTSQQNGINPQDMMLFMMLMQRQRESTTTVAAAPSWWQHGGTWYF
jgi:hypothetical protein